MAIRLTCPIYEIDPDPKFPHVKKWLDPEINTDTYWVYKLFDEYGGELFDETYFHRTAPYKNGEINEKSEYDSEDILYRLEDKDLRQHIDFYGYKNKSGILVTGGLYSNTIPSRYPTLGVYDYKNIMNRIIEIVYEINKHEPKFKLYIEKDAITGLYDDDDSDYNSKLKQKWDNETKQMWENNSLLGTFKPLKKNKKQVYEWVPNREFNRDDYDPEIIQETIDDEFKKLIENKKTLPEIKGIIDSYIGPLTKKTHFGGKRKTRKMKKTRKTKKILSKRSLRD